jgi:endonuclease YncB( thermonuclease family)
MLFERKELGPFAFGFLVGVAVGILIIGFAQLAYAGEKTYGDVVGIAVKNYDGDTLTIDIPGMPPIIGHHIGVRVGGIDTPEKHDPDPLNRDVSDKGRILVAGLCPAGAVVVVRDTWRDKYFRIGGSVTCEGIDIAQKLIDNQLATPYDGGTKPKWVGGKPHVEDRTQ